VRPVTQTQLRPRAITMWDFSWLERRWPGAGYEDWDQALDELVARGYDAVRIDAYPHLVAAGAERPWELLPVWTQQTWGAPAPITVRVMPSLLDFMSKARDRGVRVALSTWFRRDRDDVRMRLTTSAALADVWAETLDAVAAAGLMDTVLYVDLCNEFPLAIWAPFFAGSEDATFTSRTTRAVADYMQAAAVRLRARHPGVPVTFSNTGEMDRWREQDVTGLDLLEPHLWMADDDLTDYYSKVGYAFERYEPRGYDNMIANAERVYREGRAGYDAAIVENIDRCAAWSRATGLPLVTTECWAVIDYKDWPGLDWGWVLELNTHAVRHAAATGRWVALATSNFCGPQFHGVWREVGLHLELTELIKGAPIDDDLVVPPPLRTPREDYP
jgi:sugar-binding cellulase-like protein